MNVNPIVSLMNNLTELAVNNSLVCRGTHVTAWKSVSAPELGFISSHTEESSAYILKDKLSSLPEKGML